MNGGPLQILVPTHLVIEGAIVIGAIRHDGHVFAASVRLPRETGRRLWNSISTARDAALEEIARLVTSHEQEVCGGA